MHVTRAAMKGMAPRGFSARAMMLAWCVALVASQVIDVPLFAHIGIGGHSWAIHVGLFATSAYLVALNAGPIRAGLREARQA